MYRRKNTHNIYAHMALLCLVCHLKDKYATQSSVLTNTAHRWEGSGVIKKGYTNRTYGNGTQKETYTSHNM